MLVSFFNAVNVESVPLNSSGCCPAGGERGVVVDYQTPQPEMNSNV
jgi:hypothetical protein